MKPRSLRRVVAAYLAVATLVLGTSVSLLFMWRGQAVFFQNFQSYAEQPWTGHSVVPVNEWYMMASVLTMGVTVIVTVGVLRTVTKGHGYGLNEDRNREEGIN